jgi:tRNA-splicing ligase RtcB
VSPGRSCDASSKPGGIVVRCPSLKGLAEEAPLAYKDVDRVVRVVERAGLARRVARLVPIGAVKG